MPAWLKWEAVPTTGRLHPVLVAWGWAEALHTDKGPLCSLQVASTATGTMQPASIALVSPAGPPTEPWPLLPQELSTSLQLARLLGACPAEIGLPAGSGVNGSAVLAIPCPLTRLTLHSSWTLALEVQLALSLIQQLFCSLQLMGHLRVLVPEGRSSLSLAALPPRSASRS